MVADEVGVAKRASTNRAAHEAAVVAAKHLAQATLELLLAEIRGAVLDEHRRMVRKPGALPADDRGDGCCVFARVGQHFVDEAEVVITQDLVANLGVGVEVFLVVEALALAHHTQAYEQRARRAEDVAATEQRMATDLSSRDDGSLERNDVVEIDHVPR